MNAFLSLLDTLLAAPPGRRSDIEQLILDTYQCEKAVLALDMSGFTLNVRRDGILPYLCQIRRMQKLTRPIVLSHEGEVVKNEADNLLAVFSNPHQAVTAALAMIQASVDNSADEKPPITFSIGIDYGKIILLDRTDCFGDCVNLAHKLGEDIAQPGEILITQDVRKHLGDCSCFQFEEMPVSVSGLKLMAYGISYSGN